MEHKQIPKDDLQDVMELTKKLIRGIHRTLEPHNLEIAISALLSAFLHSLLTQCETVDEILFYKEVIDIHLIETIKNSKPQV